MDVSQIDLKSSAFTFSQGSLQAYVDCPRLFQLRYLAGVSWPAPGVEPALENERFLRLGSTFHQMVHQYFLGIPDKRLEEISKQDRLLQKWWTNFALHHPEIEGYEKYPEITLSTPINEHRLVAKYDLILMGAMVSIYDWKTSRKLPKAAWMISKLQTRIYRYLLANAGAHLNHGKAIAPERIRMCYWFSNHPNTPINIAYNQEKYQDDDEYIHALIAEIENTDAEIFPLTDNLKRCRFCVYRSLCNRGVEAGSFEELEEDNFEDDDLSIEIDFDQIAEIEF